MPGQIVRVDPSSDQELAGRVGNYLLDRRVNAFRQLIVSAHDGVVTLQGRVRSYYHKQLAVHSCLRVAGVRQLIDQLEVD